MTHKELRKKQESTIENTKQLLQWLTIFDIIDPDLSNEIYEISALSYFIQANPSPKWRDSIDWDIITIDDNIKTYYYGDFRLITVD